MGQIIFCDKYSLFFNFDFLSLPINAETILINSVSSLPKNTFELKYTKDYQKHTDKYYEPNDLAIDDQATVYVLGKLFKKGKKQKKDGEANYQFTLSKVDKTSNKDLKINLGDDLHIQSIVINLSLIHI